MDKIEYLTPDEARYFLACVQQMQANTREAEAKNEGIRQATLALLLPKYGHKDEALGFEPEPDGRVRVVRPRVENSDD